MCVSRVWVCGWMAYGMRTFPLTFGAGLQDLVGLLVVVSVFAGIYSWLPPPTLFGTKLVSMFEFWGYWVWKG